MSDKKTVNLPPTLALVIPCYNNSTSSLRIFDELAHQIKGNPVAVVVVDDASTDGSSAIVQRFCAKHGFVYIHSETNNGSGGARNIGAEYALKTLGAAYTAFLDSDDYITPDYITEILRGISTGADCILWGFRIVNKDGKNKNWLPQYKEVSTEVFGSPVCPWGKAIRSYLVQPFPRKIATDDAIWHFQQMEVLAEVGAKFACIEKVLYIYDRTIGGMTLAGIWLASHPTTLETLANDNTLIKMGYPDTFVSDCLRSLAAMYDIRHTLKDDRVRDAWNHRFHMAVNGLMTSRFGW